MQFLPHLTAAENVVLQLMDGNANGPHDIVNMTGLSFEDARTLFIEITKIRIKAREGKETP